MKKVFFLMLIAILALPVFQSCKKGENDPAISFLSRKARLVGEWKLTSGNRQVVYSNGETETYTYDGALVVHESTGDPTETTVYTRTFTIYKDGVFTSARFEGNNQYYEEGVWYFGPRSKDLDLKNKETVCFSTTKYTYVFPPQPAQVIEMGGTHAIGYPYVWQIDRLSNKELIFLIDEYYAAGNGNYTATGTMTYTKQ